MINVNKRLQPICDELGLKIVNVTANSHYKIDLVQPSAGKTLRLAMSRTPSDGRAEKNNFAVIRRAFQ